MDNLVKLVSEHLELDIDPGRGADILALRHRASGVDVLFSSPWRRRADAVRAGAAPTTHDPYAGWLERYRGGWQTLCPNAGAARLVAGAPVAFHGEASVVEWEVVSAGPVEADLRAELFSVPVRVDRNVTLSPDAPVVQVVDTVTNLSDVPLAVDYVIHPAFGGRFLDGECVLRTGARRFTADPETEDSVVAPGSAHPWPLTADGLDLGAVPRPGERRVLFGWLSDFDGHWASLTNVDLGLAVRIEWDGTHLPYAWLWQELNFTPVFPWFRRARVVAVEPSSTQTSGPDRATVLRLAANQAVRIPMSVTLGTTEGAR
ncbi:DUF4432 family protein [Actinokineospora sp. HUAS TT18]|uniref:DUF4432 family protein n=1 Tax=Actinokineospora sp. HUAS TT18 TaxID=3447451 RepID=UPI003F51B6F7